MGETPSHRRLKQFVRYAGSTCRLGYWLSQVRDLRRRVSIPARTLACVRVVGFAFRVASLMELASWVEAGAFRKFFRGQRGPLRDCFRDWCKRVELPSLWAMNDAILAKARRDKVFRAGTVHGWHVVAIDGTEVLRTSARGCPACQVYHHNDGRIEYAHRMVLAQTVVRPEAQDETKHRRRSSGPPPVVWGMEAQRPGEDEVGAARRLLRRLVQRHGHFCDVLTVDGAYAEAPFLNEVRALGLQAVVRLKDERYHVVQDAAGLRRGEPPQETFATRIGSKQVVVRLILQVLTTLEPAQASARVIWAIARARWGVEHEGVRELKTHWRLDHGFLHHPTGMQAIWALLVTGFNLFQLFLARRVRSRRDVEATDSGLAQRLQRALREVTEPLGPYLWDTS
ncbi:MAG: transposase [Firmicutes bacterium]|nr:transposase [Bacillota bacterium]